MLFSRRIIDGDTALLAGCPRPPAGNGRGLGRPIQLHRRGSFDKMS